LTVHWIAHVLGALISVVAIDASTQHRVFTDASSTNPWKTSEIAGRPIGDVRTRTLTVRRVAGVRGALVLIITIDASTQHRIFARAGSAHARKTAEVARHSIGYEGIVTLAIRRVAGVGGALVLIIAIDASAQHRVFTGAGSTHARKTAEVA
jgi:hypothetical protein